MTDEQNEPVEPETPEIPDAVPDAQADAARLRTQGLGNQAWMPRTFGK